MTELPQASSKVLEALELAQSASSREGQWVIVKEVNSFASEVGLTEVTQRDLDALVNEGTIERRRLSRFYDWLYRTVRIGTTAK